MGVRSISIVETTVGKGSREYPEIPRRATVYFVMVVWIFFETASLYVFNL